MESIQTRSSDMAKSPCDTGQGTPVITPWQRAEEFEKALMKIATRQGPPLSAEQVRALLGSQEGRVTIATREDVARERRVASSPQARTRTRFNSAIPSW
jgi:hypothetical protein